MYADEAGRKTRQRDRARAADRLGPHAADLAGVQRGLARRLPSAGFLAAARWHRILVGTQPRAAKNVFHALVERAVVRKRKP
jgi:hypothetical protein